MLVRTAVFKSANELVGWLLQQAADRADGAYQAKPGEVRKGRETLAVQGIFGRFPLQRDYYHHAGGHAGHYPADAALGLEGSYTPALAKLICLEGADEPTYLKAERHLKQTGGITVSARQIQRVVQRVGGDAQTWQEREAQPGARDAPILYVSADGTGVPMVPEELKGRRGKQADGTAKTRQVYLGCVFTQHRTDEKGHPVRDYESTTYVSSFQPIEAFGPLLRQEALRRGLGSAAKVVVLIDGAAGLENMGRLCFKDCLQITAPGQLLLIHHEQGLASSIQFCRAMPRWRRDACAWRWRRRPRCCGWPARCPASSVWCGARRAWRGFISNARS